MATTAPPKPRSANRMTGKRLRIELKRGRRPFVIFAVLLAVAAVCAGGLLARLNLQLSGDYTVHVAVPDAAGVTAPYSQVRIAGVQVGNVTGITYNGHQAVVTAVIKPSIGPLYRNARLTLQPNTPLQDMYLSIITRGTRAAGAVPNGGYLNVDHTTSAVNFSEVLDIFNANVRPRVTELLTDAGQGLNDHGLELREALVGLGPFLQVAGHIARATTIDHGLTARLVHNLSALSLALSQRDRSLKGLLTHAGDTMHTIESVDAPLGSLIDDLPPLLRQLPTTLSTVRSAADQLDPALTELVPAAHALRPALVSLDRLGAASLTPLRALEQPLPELTTVLDRLPAATAPLSQAFVALKPSAANLTGINRDLVPCRTGLTNLLQRILSPFKFADNISAFPRVEDVYGAQVAGGATELPIFKVMPACDSSELGK